MQSPYDPELRAEIRQRMSPPNRESAKGRGRFLYKRKGRHWELTMATDSGEEQAFNSLAQCRRILRYKNAGVEFTALHALLWCYLMQLKDPSSRFTVSGEQLLRDLGQAEKAPPDPTS